jgi:hypothetical protein
MFRKKFSRVFIFSPSLRTIQAKLALPDDRFVDHLDLDRLEGILEELRESEHNALIILDDLVSQISKGMKPILTMVRNRRHYGKGLSVLITTQKLTGVPLELRAAASAVICFPMRNKTEIEALYREYATLDRQDFMALLRLVWADPHNFLYLKLDEPEERMHFRNFDPIKIIYEKEKRPESESEQTS